MQNATIQTTPTIQPACDLMTDGETGFGAPNGLEVDSMQLGTLDVMFVQRGVEHLVEHVVEDANRVYEVEYMIRVLDCIAGHFGRDDNVE
jgi:hypothetical protein